MRRRPMASWYHQLAPPGIAVHPSITRARQTAVTITSHHPRASSWSGIVITPSQAFYRPSRLAPHDGLICHECRFDYDNLPETAPLVITSGAADGDCPPGPFYRPGSNPMSRIFDMVCNFSQTFPTPWEGSETLTAPTFAVGTVRKGPT